MDVGAKARHEAQVGWEQYVLPADGQFAITAPIIAPPTSFTICHNGRELLRVTSDGGVIAPTIEGANEAGRVFVESIGGYIAKLVEALVERRARALLADETWRALA